MTDTSVTIAAVSAPPAPPTEKPKRFRGATRRAIDFMIWEGLTDNEAAVKAGITVTAIRLALKERHVRAYYHAQLEVLRERESARNIHRLVAIRDAANNMPAVQAIDRLQRIDAEASARSTAQQQAPGFVIYVQSGPAHTPHMRQVNSQPTDNTRVIQDQSVIDGTALPNQGSADD